MNPPTIQTATAADDTLQGSGEIAAYIGKSQRRTYYLLETGQIPGFKLANQWHMRKSTYLAHLEKLEAAWADTRSGHYTG